MSVRAPTPDASAVQKPSRGNRPPASGGFLLSFTRNGGLTNHHVMLHSEKQHLYFTHTLLPECPQLKFYPGGLVVALFVFKLSLVENAAVYKEWSEA